MADDPSVSAAFDSHEALQRFLQRRGLEKAWYAISTRAHQFNGKELILTSYGRPFEMPLKTPEFRAVIETLTGRAAPHDFADFTAAKVRIIPERLANSQPPAVIGELLESSEQREGSR